MRRRKIVELPELWNVLIGDMGIVGPCTDVLGLASLKYRDEEDLLAKQPDPQKYNDEVIFPDKVRINLYYLHHYSFPKDIRMIFATILGHRIRYADEVI